MAHSGAPRTLSLPEELERLEQQITLTLQEIDGNFSKAHRIVTSSILPIVEQYAKHSNEVWEGSKFWKQFFEASANVSLSGYEEPPAEEDTLHTDETSTSLHTPTDRDEDSTRKLDVEDSGDEDLTIDSPSHVTGIQSTPKLAPSTGKKSTGTARKVRDSPNFRSPSPRKYTGRSPFGADRASSSPITPRPRSRKHDASSPLQPESAFLPSAGQPLTRQNNDPLMHRVLDKTYRLQATPHVDRSKQPKQPHQPVRATLATATKARPWDDSPQSSPIDAAPQLRTELFSPPPKGARTPGVSVLTPARNKSKAAGAAPTTSTGRQLFSPQDKTYANTQRTRTSQNIFTDVDDSDTDLFQGMSPPKTMQFHIPQSRLVQTPAREASRKIVEDLLLTAGAEDTDDIEGIDDFEIDLSESPSFVRQAPDETDAF